jgi:truncated hemoglobin YjbI
MKTLITIATTLIFFTLAGCGAGKQRDGSGGFFTSGSKEADQRADQRMAKAEQLQGGGEGAGEKKAKPAKPEEGKPAQAQDKITLYDRLGGEEGLKKIVNDFIDRALADPRVNWERKGVTRGGLTLSRGKPVTWNATPENVAQLKKHVVQMLSIATGGPNFYDGRDMKEAHTGLRVSNPEFDAAVGDLKATLDKLQTPNKEQKELLAIIESTRPQVVEER